MTRLLGLCGSLRAGSVYMAMLRAAQALTPEGAVLSLSDAPRQLPHFDPDLEATAPPEVRAFQAEVGASGGVLLATPEYAHGLPGSFKNALDWLVGSGELVNTPVALLGVVGRGGHAQAQLLEILRTMDARPVPGSPFELGLTSNRVTMEDLLERAEWRDALTRAVQALVEAG